VNEREIVLASLLVSGFPGATGGLETALLQMSVEQFLFVHVSCFMNPSSERVPAFRRSLQVAQLEHKTALVFAKLESI